MLEWKDRWWCEKPEDCANAETCNRVLSDAEAMRAHHEGYLICYRLGHCEKFKPKQRSQNGSERVEQGV